MQNEIQSNILNIQSKTVNNAIIQLGDIDNSGKGKHFKSKFIQPGLVKIEGHGIVLLKKETLDQSLKSMVGSPVIIKHQDVTEDNANELRCGVISDAYFNEPDGWFYCEGIVWDEEAQQHIQNDWSVSCSYDFLSYNDEGGVENNIKYDKEFTQLNFTHLALVDNPRYERANIVFNSKDEEKGKWITIKGNHIFIPDGKTLDEVIEEKGWVDKGESKEKSKLVDILKKHYEDDKIDYHNEIGKYLGVGISQDDVLTAMEYAQYKQSGDWDTSKMADKLLEIAEKKKTDKKPEPSKPKEKPKEKEDTRTLISYMKNKQSDYKSVQEIDDTISRLEKEIKEEDDAYYIKDMRDDIKLLKEWKHKFNKTDNSKEQDMALLEEIKKLISKVENSKENDMEIENEKVDKRDIIRQIMAIAGKEEASEDVKTIAKLAEKLAYDKSEAGSADNKKVKNEEEEKVENKKCNNEDEEDKEKVEDIKEEVKEDVDNKCKNSKEDYSSFDKINQIYNSVKQVMEEKTFVSRQEKLDNAVEYFK